ncbi:MAG: hypothetical protein B7Z15_13655 [Rhizobiales bacterium 32-66-8]|nr:MAG: hypothetical protein B7Z15_13655 [Rhizobiales bacterium 32-66-8]
MVSEMISRRKAITSGRSQWAVMRSTNAASTVSGFSSALSGRAGASVKSDQTSAMTAANRSALPG